MHNITNGWVWFGFSIFLITALTLDTLLVNRKTVHHAHESMRSALAWTLIWVACAILFNGVLWIYLYLTADIVTANKKALDFFTGYLIEKSLSIDNLFAFYVIFHQFHIPVKYQQRVFTYGIWSAIVLRLLLILLGSWLVSQFHWVLYLMGVFLLLTGSKMLFESSNQTEKNLYESPIFCWLKQHLRLTHEFHGEDFFVKINHLRYATPLFIALIFIEISDIVFAFDSIPAIFAITTDPFIVWTSNIFAILGLRALYFLLAGVVRRFYLLKYAIALILVFVGMKMVIEPWLKISVITSLIIIVTILLVFIVMSIRNQRVK